MTVLEPVYRSAETYTISYLRSSEPNLEAVARETTGGIVRTAYAQAPEIQALLGETAPRHHHKRLHALVSSMKRRMEEEKAAVYQRAYELMTSPEWEAASGDEQLVYLLKVAQATDDSAMGGPNPLQSLRVQETAMFRYNGTKRAPNTLAAICRRLESKGWFTVERGKRGHANREHATRYHLLEGLNCTRPVPAGRPCAIEAWTAEWEPVFEVLRALLADAVGYIRTLKADPKYRKRHIPWAECYHVPDQGLSQDDVAMLCALLDDPPVPIPA